MTTVEADDGVGHTGGRPAPGEKPEAKPSPFPTASPPASAVIVIWGGPRHDDHRPCAGGEDLTAPLLDPDFYAGDPFPL